MTPLHRPPPADYWWARAFLSWGRGLHAETARSALRVVLRLVIGGPTSVLLIALGTVSLQFQGWLVPVSWGWFSKRWQLMSWPWSGHRVVNFPHPVGVSASVRRLTGPCQNITHSPWGGNKCPWLSLLTKLLWFCLVWLLSFASAFSHFSLCWLEFCFHRQKAGRGHGGGHRP